ncbi:MAG: RNase J family beta-CASP ribonuclease [Firmicutes bacterium]|nr:RNase J family beta-CASP ribonuclease [Bacillota bacterium]
MRETKRDIKKEKTKKTTKNTNTRKEASTEAKERPSRAGKKNAVKRSEERVSAKASKRRAKTPSKAAGERKPIKKTGKAKSEERTTVKRTAARTSKTANSAKLTKAPKLTNKDLGELKIYPIGGLNEIGKNMTVLEYNNQFLIIDCGMSFPEDDMYGIDIVIPDFSLIEKNAKRLVGLVVTHGHEDHIGAIPYLLKKVNVPIYGTAITIGLIENKLKEHGIKGDMHVFDAGDALRLGEFTVETVHTTHSVADAVCFYVTTPAATLFHTGDFKVDYTPIDGKPIDLQHYAEIGERGVDIMLSDSTNATRAGFTKSEQHVGEALAGIFRNAKGRIIIATFSSNINRIQKIIDLTAKYGRHFSVSGKSMEKVVTLAQELGYLKIPDGAFVDMNAIENENDNKLVVITTGSQGEPMSALARMANDEHKSVKLRKGDTVILSSTPVPGNEKSVSNVVNRLYQKDVNVIYNEVLDIHVSGHACQEELKLVHTLIKPKFFMPVHGETRHLAVHAELAKSLGMKSDKIFILANGDELAVTKKKAVMSKNMVSADDVLVDGLGIGDVGTSVLRERKQMSTAGLVVIAAALDMDRGVIMSGPKLKSHGFIYVKGNDEIISEAEHLAEKVIFAKLEAGTDDIQEVQDAVKTEIRRFITKRTQRSPIIMPLFMEI